MGASSSVDVASKPKEEISPPRTLFFGVYDGHAGKRCSNRIARNIPLTLSRHPSFYLDLPSALMETYLHVDEKFLGWARRHNFPDGSTACTVLRRGETLFICNTGDSRAILSRKVGLAGRWAVLWGKLARSYAPIQLLRKQYFDICIFIR